jgi:hypothetical protein
VIKVFGQHIGIAAASVLYADAEFVHLLVIKLTNGSFRRMLQKQCRKVTVGSPPLATHDPYV